MDANGREWTRMDANGREWTRMDANGRESGRIHLELISYVGSRVLRVASPEIGWVGLGASHNVQIELSGPASLRINFRGVKSPAFR
jgi:hypothetical protein